MGRSSGVRQAECTDWLVLHELCQPACVAHPPVGSCRLHQVGSCRLPAWLTLLGTPPLPAVVSGLEPGHRYSLRCSAINAQGSSGWGPVAQAETLPGLPYPVDSLTLGAATANTIKLRWSAPYGRGAPVTSYAVEVAEAAALAQQQATAQAAAQQQQLEAEQGADQEAGGSQGLGGRDDEAVAALDALFRPVYQGHDCHCSGAAARNWRRLLLCCTHSSCHSWLRAACLTPHLTRLVATSP